MKKLLILFLLLATFSGCINMRTMDDCIHLDAQEEASKNPWLLNPAGALDEHYIMKANISCWHSAAIAYAAKNNPSNATACCEEIRHVSNDPSDETTLYREYVLCIDSISTRLADPSICERILEEDYEFEKNRCMAHAEKPEPVCVATAFSLLALGFAFLSGKR
ncbi:MAG: hypothetical protein ACLFUZ_01465 [Candidatus Micrarchaeia archaeon]